MRWKSTNLAQTFMGPTDCDDTLTFLLVPPCCIL